MRLLKLTMAALAALWLAVLPAAAQFGLRGIPLGFCYDNSLGSAIPLTSFTCASFTGTGSSTTLTAASVSGLIQPGQTVNGSGVPAGTTIVKQLTGTAGGAGTYQTSQATTSSNSSLTTSGAPQAADYAVVCAYGEAVNYRDDGTAPTSSTGTGGQGIAAGNCIGYNGTMTNLQFIQLTGGAAVGVTFYNSATQ